MAEKNSCWNVWTLVGLYSSHCLNLTLFLVHQDVTRLTLSMGIVIITFLQIVWTYDDICYLAIITEFYCCDWFELSLWCKLFRMMWPGFVIQFKWRTWRVFVAESNRQEIFLPVRLIVKLIPIEPPVHNLYNDNDDYIILTYWHVTKTMKRLRKSLITSCQYFSIEETYKSSV